MTSQKTSQICNVVYLRRKEIDPHSNGHVNHKWIQLAAIAHCDAAFKLVHLYPE